MWRYAVVVSLLVGCGSDDEVPGSERPCQVMVAGNAGGLDSCRMFLCYPRDSTYEALDLARADNAVLEHTLQLEVEHPTKFAAGTLTLDQLKSRTQINIVTGGKHYAARHTPQSGTRHADETAVLTIDKVYPPTGDDVCSGSVYGVLTASLVEILNPNTASETVGIGRLTITAQLGQ